MSTRVPVPYSPYRYNRADNIDWTSAQVARELGTPYRYRGVGPGRFLTGASPYAPAPYVAPPPAPPQPQQSLFDRALSGVGRIISAPYRAVSSGVSAIRGTFEGDPTKYFELTPEGRAGGFLGDVGGVLGLTESPVVTPDAAQTAKAGLLAAAGYLGGAPVEEFTGERVGLGSTGTGLADQTEAERRAWEERHPFLSRAKAVAGPVSDLALTLGLDPTIGAATAAPGALGGLGRTFAPAARASLPLMIPGMVHGAYTEGKEALEELASEGVTPKALEHGTRAAMDALFAYGALKHTLGRYRDARLRAAQAGQPVGEAFGPDLPGIVPYEDPVARGFDIDPEMAAIRQRSRIRFQYPEEVAPYEQGDPIGGQVRGPRLEQIPPGFEGARQGMPPEPPGPPEAPPAGPLAL